MLFGHIKNYTIWLIWDFQVSHHKLICIDSTHYFALFREMLKKIK